MADRLDAVYPRSYKNRDGDEKTDWMRCGSAFANEKGQTTVYLNLMPCPGPDGQIKIMLMEPRQRDGATPQRQTGGGSQGNRQRSFDDTDDDLNDSVPFMSMTGNW